jgi:hypothetical protein
LFQPSAPHSDDEDDLIQAGLKASIRATGAGADADAGLRTLSSASADVSIKEETTGEGSSVIRTSASTGTLNSADSSLPTVPIAAAARDGTSMSAHSSSLALTDLNGAVKEAFWLKHRSNVMIVKEQAKFCLKEKIPIGRQVYKVKGTLTLHINCDKKVRKIELLHSFDTSMHK